MVNRKSISLSLASLFALSSGGLQAEPASSPVLCEQVISVSDTLVFKPDEVKVSQDCDYLTIILRHDGRLPKAAAARNWVLTHSKDVNTVVRNSVLIGKQKGWVDPNDSAVIAYSPVIGRNEKAEVVVAISDLSPNESYTYLSTVPGTSSVLRGSLSLKSEGSSFNVDQK